VHILPFSSSQVQCIHAREIRQHIVGFRPHVPTSDVTYNMIVLAGDLNIYADKSGTIRLLTEPVWLQSCAPVRSACVPLMR